MSDTNKKPRKTRQASSLRKPSAKAAGRKTSAKKVKATKGKRAVMLSTGNTKLKKSSSVRRSASKNALTTSTASVRRPDIHPLDRAIGELRAELSRMPEDPTLLARLAALYYRRGDLKEAEKQYRAAVSLAPERANLQNNLGNVLCDMGRMRDGIACYEKAMAIEKALHPDRPTSIEALINLEMARTEYRLIQERIEYLERASQLEVTSSEAMNALGCGYLLRGWHEKALGAFRKAASMDPRNVLAGLNIAFTHTLSVEASGDINSALSEVAEFTIRFPNHARLHLHQGELFENAGLLEEAEQRYLRAVQADPHCLEAYDLLGKLREVTGYAGARDAVAQSCESLLKAMESAAKQQSQTNKAQALYDLAFVQVARSKFNRTTSPLSAESEQQLQQLLRAAMTTTPSTGGAGTDGSGAASGSSLSTVNCQLSTASQAAILRAHLLEIEGKRTDAILVLENACAKEESGSLWFERGGLALRSGNVDEALRSFERATLAMPEDAVAGHSLRFAFEGFRRYKTEQVRFETAIRANPRDGMAHQHLALAALSVLKDEEALQHFTRALEMDPRLSDAACGRGRALQRLGRWAEAENAYVKALDIDPENPEAQRSLMALRSQKLVSSIVAALPRVEK